MVSEPVQVQDIEMNELNHHKQESINQYLKQLQSITNSTKKQEQQLEKLLQSPQLLDQYLQVSPDCKEIFNYLNETNDAFNELSNSSIKLNINETNADILFECIEKSILNYQSKLLNNNGDNEEDNLNYSEIRKYLTDLCSNLIKSYLNNLITKCLLIKSTTKKTLKLQETIIRLLTLCVTQNIDLAKQIAIEYNFFNDFKNWLERYLLMKQTDLRELSIKFLLSFLKHVKVFHSSSDQVSAENDLVKGSGENREFLLIIKKIFLNTDQQSNTNSKLNKKQSNGSNHASSSLIMCLFLHVQSDSKESIEFMLHELLFRLVQNDSFNKSEKVKLFNEKTLSSLIKLLEWKKEDQEDKAEDQTLIVREMIAEFLKILFCSTKFGISFYDKTLNIGESQSTKNYNHLIFNALINVPKVGVHSGKTKLSQKQLEINEKTNLIIDQLVLRTLKVCPDLIQRYLKVKQKQQLNMNLQNQNDESFIKFCTSLFDQQNLIIKNMRKNYLSSSSFLRSISYSSSSEIIDLKNFLCELIIHTSLPLCYPFYKVFQPTTNLSSSRQENLLKLVTSCLNCLKEWKQSLKMFKSDYQAQLMNSNELNSTDRSKLELINENLTKLITENYDNENIFTKLNLELLTKYLPKLDILLNDTSSNVMLTFDIFNLYFDIFMNDNENSTSECLSLLQLDSLENNLIKLIPKILDLDNLYGQCNQDICVKYLSFLIKYLHLKQRDDFNSWFQSSSNLDNSVNLIDLNLNKQNQLDHKNLILLNLVKIMIKYDRNEDNFQSLVQYYLDIIGVYLNEDSQYMQDAEEYDDEVFKYDKYSMFLFFTIVKNKFNNIISNIESVNLFKDYIYVCLFNLLDLKQRNMIINELKLTNFNQILIFICLKTYFLFIEKFNNLDLTSINGFIFDYIFSYGLTISSHTNKQFFDLNKLFQLSIGDDSAKQSEIDLFISKLKENYNEINSLNVLTLKSSKKKVKTLSESYMTTFERKIDLKPAVQQDGIIVSYLNLNLRVRHLLFLIDLFKNDSAKIEDMKLVLDNLKNCLVKSIDLSKFNNFDLNGYNSNLQRLILNNAILVENVFKNELVTQFLFQSWSIINNEFYSIKYFQTYLNIFLNDFENYENELNLSFIVDLFLEFESFQKLIHNMVAKLGKESNSNRFLFFVKILLKNQEYLFEKDLNLLDELNILDQRHFDSLEMLSQCLKTIFIQLQKLDAINDANLAKFLIRSYQYKPILFKIIFKVCLTLNDKIKLSKNFKKFLSIDPKLVKIIDSCLSNDLSLNNEESKNGQDDLDLDVSNEAKLINDYKYTLSERDQKSLKEIYNLDSKLENLRFKLDNNIQVVNSSTSYKDILNKQAKMSDFISMRLNDSIIVQTIRNYPNERKLSDLTSDSKPVISLSKYFDSNVYDPIYVLPNMFNLLEYSNVVDLIQFIQSKCLSLLMASLSSECDYLRLMSYGCIYRFLAHLENSHIYCKNILKYMIELLRNSLVKENQRLPSTISVFLAETILVIIEPGTTLYKPIMSFLLLKPTLDLTNVPEFYKLFNSSALQYKVERKWILTILSHSCRSSLDYRLFEKRFVYRQLLSIYDSKMSEMDIKVLILNLLLKTCECKFALIDLIKRHYFLIWLTSALESLNQMRLNQNESNFKLLIKMIQIFNLTWKQLGVVLEESHQVPITFLNQMYTLMKIILNKLSSNQKMVLINANEKFLQEFFQVKAQLINSFEKYEFNLINYNEKYLESLDKKLIDLSTDESINFDRIIDTIRSRYQNKRKNFNNNIINNENSKKKIKTC